MSSDELAAARDEMRTSYAAAHDAEPDAKLAVEEASHAYLPYRDAEVALYERLHPGARDMLVLMLGREHAAHLCGTVPP